MGVSNRFGTHLTENHLGTLFALFLGQPWDQMGKKCQYFALRHNKYHKFWTMFNLIGGTVRAIKKCPKMKTDMVRAGITENWPFLSSAKKCFFGKKSVLSQKRTPKDWYLFWKRQLFSLNNFFRAWPEHGELQEVYVFLGLKSRFLVQKSNFCHTTPILVNDPFVALGVTVHFQNPVDPSKSLPPPQCEGTVCQ